MIQFFSISAGNNKNPRYKVRTCEIYRKIDKTDKDAFVKVEDENAHYAIRLKFFSFFGIF